jgi:chemotaxis protein CheD
MFPVNKNNDADRLRFGDTSLEDMLSQMIRIGARKQKIISRVYGGSTMFLYTVPNLNIGQQNIDVAIRFLKENDIPVKSLETGGRLGRKIIFDTSAAVISCSLLKSQVIDGI